MTVTLSLAYLAVLTHQRNRQSQSDTLRAQSAVLTSLTRTAAPPPTEQQQPTTPSWRRHDLAETAKDRWNAELQGAVRWAQDKDWAGAREAAETAVARLLWGGGGADAGSAQRREEGEAGVVAGAVRGAGAALGEAGARTADAVHVRAEETRDAVRVRAGEAREAVHVKAGEARAAVARGVEKGKEAVGRARATVGLAEERFESRVDAKLLRLSDVEKALSERYEKGDEVMSKSVEEILSDRYKPIDQRDNTKLRGL